MQCSQVLLQNPRKISKDSQGKKLHECSLAKSNSLQLAFHFQIEVIPWVIADSNYLKSASQKLDPSKTVFVGALHGQLTAKGLAQIMDDIFKGVIYAGMYVR